MIADQFDIFLLDLDGVVHVGDALLPGADVALAALRSRGRTLRFVTNDPRPTRQDVVQRLGRLGVDATVEEIVSSGWATACWLREHRVTRAYVVGSDGLRRELAAQGVEHGEGLDVEAVVVGCDETIGYRHLARAGALVRAGVLFVATNADSTFPTAAGPRPATGAIVAAVQAAGGRRPIVIGKPGPEMFRLARRGLPHDGRVVVVGDTPGTDVAGAHRAGLPAILVAPAPSSRDREQVGPDAAEARITGLPELFAPAVEMRPVRPLPYPWPSDVRAGVAAVVFDEAGHVLLGRRVDNGLWGLPSGHVEAGETVVQAVVREVAEETGVQVRPRRLIGVYSDPASQVFAYPDGRVTQFVTTTFACVRVDGQARADAVETSQVAFFPPDRLPTPLLPMHPRWLTDALSGRTGLLDGEGTDDGEITGADDGEIEGTDDGVRPGPKRSVRPASRPS